MLTLFYQMKVKKNKVIAFTDYYSDVLENMDPTYPGTEEGYVNKCRVCLREGSISIYGNDHTAAIVEVVERYSNIILNKQDEYPKHLCTVCNNFVNAAILFGKTANRVDEIVKQQLNYKSNILDGSEDIHEYSNDSVNEKDTNTKSGKSEEHVSFEKRKRTVKCTTKVTCHICSKVITRSYYKEHVTMHDPNHKKYVCDVCGKSFRLRCAYYNHSLRHRTDFPYKCQFCPYRGRYVELLKTHMRTHTGDYRYMCTECPARFLVKSNLNSHMLKHKEPSFKCESCKRAFHTKLTLKRHFEVDHMGIKNHICGMCGKAFGNRNSLMKHERRVHKREKQLFGRMPAYLQIDSGNQE